ncbi:hypothetical protein [Neogemmobacter tilapiae]|uniref:Uncharacterized protein n=1 Tax=Neogemmobacter tilapiae TaxID=875041 RepID=A0A918TTU2_9RHOB|nr:hypothetical protein [Gemmobacter tilapiae]GHC56312.1 hypothetical protein GCM10007315_19530 [Gemmobacter tilapiae]
MDNLAIISSSLRGGVWAGRIGPVAGGALPDLQVLHLDRVLEGLVLARGEDGVTLTFRVNLPVEVLSDGVQTVVLQDAAGQRIGSLALVAGEALEADIRAEVDLLRAELDMLKRAFRRHCVETGADK